MTGQAILNFGSVIAATINEWNNPFIERAIFATDDPLQIAEHINGFCVAALGTAIVEGLFYEQSQGAVFGVRLADGRHVVVKAYQPGWSPEYLDSVFQIQCHLVDSGYPCPRPLFGPLPLGHGHAIAMELVDTGTYADAHNPVIRRVMAELLALLVELTRDFRGLPGLQRSMHHQHSSDALWPKPHSNIFDFEATATGAEWIDQLAGKARQTLAQGVGEMVIGHTDWAVKDFRFVGSEVSVIYDWDSLALERETIIVGQAARGFTMTWHIDVPLAPSPEEARAFVREYEAVRGKAFTAAEWGTMAAAVTYAIAYGARCEHSLDPRTTDFPVGSYRGALAHYGAGFLGNFR